MQPREGQIHGLPVVLPTPELGVEEIWMKNLQVQVAMRELGNTHNLAPIWDHPDPTNMGTPTLVTQTQLSAQVQREIRWTRITPVV